MATALVSIRFGVEDSGKKGHLGTTESTESQAPHWTGPLRVPDTLPEGKPQGAPRRGQIPGGDVKHSTTHHDGEPFSGGRAGPGWQGYLKHRVGHK